MVNDDRVTAVIVSLSSLILSNLCGAAHNQYFPTSSPDDNDENIKKGKDRAKALRKMRDEFEDLASGVIK